MALGTSTYETLHKRLEQLYSDWSECTRCSLSEFREEIGNGILTGNGLSGEEEYRQRVMFVIDRLDPSEIINGEFQTGHHGKILGELLQRLGVDLDDVWSTPTSLCPTQVYDPEDWRTPELAKPANGKQMRACRPRLMREIHIVQPLVVVAMGANAYEAVMGKHKARYKFSTHMGQTVPAIIQGDLIEYTVPTIPTHSPNRLLRNMDMSKESLWHHTYKHVGTALRLAEKYLDASFGIYSE